MGLFFEECKTVVCSIAAFSAAAFGVAVLLTDADGRYTWPLESSWHVSSPAFRYCHEGEPIVLITTSMKYPRWPSRTRDLAACHVRHGRGGPLVDRKGE